MTMRTPPDHLYRNWIEAVFVILVVLGAVMAAPLVASRVARNATGWQIICSSVAFLLLTSAGLVDLHLLAAAVARTLLHTFFGFLAAGVFLLVASVGLGLWPVGPPLLIAAILVPAFVEELVFRRALPHRFMRLLSRRSLQPRHAWLLGQFVAQILFAASHFMPSGSPSRTRGLSEALRLFAAGVLYANIAERRGLWLAGGIHAALNLSLRFSRDFTPHKLGLAVLLLCLICGLWGLFHASRRWQVCSVTTRDVGSPLAVELRR